ncbi:DUF551 domain-containing protein [Cronobacter sakazakii]
MPLWRVLNTETIAAAISQTNEYGLISNVTHWMPLPEPPL